MAGVSCTRIDCGRRTHGEHVGKAPHTWWSPNMLPKQLPRCVPLPAFFGQGSAVFNGACEGCEHTSETMSEPEQYIRPVFTPENAQAIVSQIEKNGYSSLFDFDHGVYHDVTGVREGTMHMDMFVQHSMTVLLFWWTGLDGIKGLVTVAMQSGSDSYYYHPWDTNVVFAILGI